MLYPTRVVLEKNQRAAQVEITNNGTAAETYRINIVNRRMGLNGEFIAIETPGPGEQFAQDLLRYSPRQVTLAPGGSQVVRILVRKPADLKPGEYRSHLQFDRVADTEGASSLDQAAGAQAGEIGVKITALVGASIPLIVRHGDTQAAVTLSDLMLPDTSNASAVLTAQINRSGNRSVFGDLSVHFTPRGGPRLELAQMGGVAVYLPNAVRRVRVTLVLPAGTVLADGSLSLLFRERADVGAKLIAESTLVLP